MTIPDAPRLCLTSSGGGGGITPLSLLQSHQIAFIMHAIGTVCSPHTAFTNGGIQAALLQSPQEEKSSTCCALAPGPAGRGVRIRSSSARVLAEFSVSSSCRLTALCRPEGRVGAAGWGRSGWPWVARCLAQASRDGALPTEDQGHSTTSRCRLSRYKLSGNLDTGVSNRAPSIFYSERIHKL